MTGPDRPLLTLPVLRVSTEATLYERSDARRSRFLWVHDLGGHQALIPDVRAKIAEYEAALAQAHAVLALLTEPRPLPDPKAKKKPKRVA